MQFLYFWYMPLLEFDRIQSEAARKREYGESPYECTGRRPSRALEYFLHFAKRFQSDAV